KADGDLLRMLDQASCTRFLETHWEIPYAIMMNPVGDHTYIVSNATEPIKKECLNVFSFQKIPAHGGFLPLLVPRKGFSGLSLLGTFDSSYGPEWAFGFGSIPGVQPQNRYIVLKITESSADVQVSALYGFDPRDNLEFWFEIQPRNHEN